ncbi:hypothetical protein [Paraclostridium bifermentans]|uniref:hypothetical protein n=1 Tax=Paraclostridium bifermentans TaxID=1490 RepID=UPI00359C91B0
MYNEICPKCGSSEFGNGELTGSWIVPKDNPFSLTGSKLILEICTECGHVVNMKVNKPHKFKK